ncbi:hypothetical protein FRC03_011439 [Tulasnella sp. 419]|nr:hypothetical protein FRC03_011439 [Tulasnella sp. 419]
MSENKITLLEQLADQLVSGATKLIGKKVAPQTVRSDIMHAKRVLKTYRKEFPKHDWATDDLKKQLEETELKLKMITTAIKAVIKNKNFSEDDLAKQSARLAHFMFDLNYFKGDVQITSSEYEKRKLRAKDPRYPKSSLSSMHSDTSLLSQSSSVLPSLSEDSLIDQAEESNVSPTSTSPSERKDSLDWTVATFCTADGRNVQIQKETEESTGGSFSRVWMCQVHKDHVEIVGYTKVAFKQLVVTRMLDVLKVERDLKLAVRLAREKENWMKLEEHPNIAQLLGCTSDKPIGLASPWYANGTIDDFSRGKPLDVKIRLLKGAAVGLAYMHSKAMTHSDLKSSNILVDDQGEARIIDFGGSFIPEELGGSGVASTTVPDAGFWMSPDRVGWDGEGDSRLGKLSPMDDMYSYGLIGIHIITEQLPYHPIVPHDVYHKLSFAVNNNRPLPPPARPEGWPEWEGKQLWDLLKDCWAIDPDKRPTAHSMSNRLHTTS